MFGGVEVFHRTVVIVPYEVFQWMTGDDKLLNGAKKFVEIESTPVKATVVAAAVAVAVAGDALNSFATNWNLNSTVYPFDIDAPIEPLRAEYGIDG